MIFPGSQGAGYDNCRADIISKMLGEHALYVFFPFFSRGLHGIFIWNLTPLQVVHYNYQTMTID